MYEIIAMIMTDVNINVTIAIRVFLGHFHKGRSMNGDIQKSWVSTAKYQDWPTHYKKLINLGSYKYPKSSFNENQYIVAT